MTEAITIDVTDARAVIKGWLDEHLNEAFPDIGGVYYENQEYTPPQLVNGDLEASSWFFIEIVNVAAKQADFGTNNPGFETDGNVYVHCRTPMDKGSGQAYAMANAVENIMRRNFIGVSGLRFRAPWSRPLRAEYWFQVMVTCPFTASATIY